MQHSAEQESVSKSNTMKEITTLYPGARRALFARYHIGGCSSCAYKDDETLADVCERNIISLDEVLEHILNSHKEDLKMLIAPMAAKKLLDEGRNVKFIDTRTREEHEAVAIKNSIFMTQELQQEVFSTWNRSDELTIVLYDHTGKNALDTCAWFVGHEMKNTVALIGGIDAWSQEVDSSVARYRLEM